jgi:hypothetical protein
MAGRGKGATSATSIPSSSTPSSATSGKKQKQRSQSVGPAADDGSVALAALGYSLLLLMAAPLLRLEYADEAMPSR